MKRRSCRMSDHERKQHATAVAIRKMTDQQLCNYLEQLQAEGFEKGQNAASAEMSTNTGNAIVKAFIQRLNVKCGTGNGIGKSTVHKIKLFAEEEGYLEA